MISRDLLKFQREYHYRKNMIRNVLMSTKLDLGTRQMAPASKGNIRRRFLNPVGSQAIHDKSWITRPICLQNWKDSPGSTQFYPLQSAFFYNFRQLPLSYPVFSGSPAWKDCNIDTWTWPWPAPSLPWSHIHERRWISSWWSSKASPRVTALLLSFYSSLSG